MSTHAEPRPLVWICDDSPIEATYTRRALGPNYDIELFEDGSLVIERLANGRGQPDVLLLDWVMPTMSGDEVCRFLRSQPQTKDMPIIFVTASRIETDDVVAGLAQGANDYVPRPFVPEELRARVDSVIRAKRLREQVQREHVRLSAIAKLGRAFIAMGPRVGGIADSLASCLIESLCDGCTVTVIPGVMPGMTVARHRSPGAETLLQNFTVMEPCTHAFGSADEARRTLPPAYHSAIDQLGMSAIAVLAFPPGSPVTGVVTVMRDGCSLPFAPDDLIAIQTCLEYTTMAFENALRADAERAVRRQLQTVLEYLPVSIVVTDRSGALTHVNQVALEHLPPLRGARTLDEVQRQITFTTPDGAVVEGAESPLARALRGETSRGVELQLRVGDGAPWTMRASAVPFHDSNGLIDGAVLAFDDVTAEKAGLAERERAAEFQRYVLGIVSHDLRSPLQAFIMGCEGIKLLGTDNPKVDLTVDRMLTATRRMHGIIEQLLDVVRSQLGGGIPVHPAPVDLRELVTGVLSELTLAYPNAKFEPRLDAVRGQWDPGRLAQVITNVIGNAIQHGVAAAPVWIETAQSGDEALVRVRNMSKGPLTDEQIATMFSPFRRTKRASGGSGLGLGLYITSEILRAHQGRISVSADPTTTTFTVRLPLAPRAA